MKKRSFIALTGASGAVYGFNIIKTLNNLGYETHITATQDALLNAEVETGSKYSSIEDMFYKNGITESVIHDIDHMSAGPASGSYLIEHYIVAPASMGFIGRTANGISSNLAERCIDVAIKEKRKAVLLFREMPLSSIHLENMLKLSNNGVIIMPAAPAFYHKPENILDMVNFTTGKVLDSLGIENDCFKRWNN